MLKSMACWLAINWLWFIEIPILVVVVPMIRYFTTQPKIQMEISLTVGFNPSRTVWTLSIENIGRSGWRKFIWGERKTLEGCYIEADFIIEDKIPSMPDNKAAVAIWGENAEGTINLQPHNPYSVELISRIHRELGFHIKYPNQDTLLIANETLVIVAVKRGIEVITMGAWAITITGNWSSDLSIERIG